jgi:leucyl-tRNA synthetase
MLLFNSWYNLESNKAESIEELIRKFEDSGNHGINAVSDEDAEIFSDEQWKQKSDIEKQTELLKYRLTYLRESTVNWCPSLGTVLANDEVKDGYSERGGYAVEQKKMMQWSMRITAYADRLLQGLDNIDWPDPLKEMQRNWIGKSVGALVRFGLNSGAFIEVFTTRVDTLYGTTFLVLAPEHELVEGLTTPDHIEEIQNYIDQTKKKTELDRMADTKTVSGAFTGSYAKHPISGAPVPIWIADYVLAGYGTGAVMAVPSGDQRDWLFATKFGLPIVAISDAQLNLDIQADPTKDGLYINSGIINGLNYKQATALMIAKLEELGAGKAKINYRLRDAIFGRQRYWGEPVPVYFKDNLPQLIAMDDLPLVLPEVDKYLPTESGEPPLGRAENWKYKGELEYELSTMPGWAGSSWYWYRYMASQDDRKQDSFAPANAIAYWKDVDLYIGGSEHATGHLLYSRFWNKFLKDLGYVVEEEPFKKLINQGMIQGRSNFVYRIIDQDGRGTNTFVSHGLKSQYNTSALHVDVNIVFNEILDLEKFKAFRSEFADAEFILENDKYICGVEVEKMSKSKFNVVSPDDIIERYGADTLRMYEMFLGPLEQSKPWNTNGIEGVFKFLRKFWKLSHDDEFNFKVSDDEPSKAEYKALHKIIRKVEEDIERFSFNTSVSSFMICINELTDLKCNKRKIIQDLVIVLSSYAPHISEELWTLLGNVPGTLSVAPYPVFNPEYLVENEFSYPVSVNGKTRMNLNISLSLSQAEVEVIVLANTDLQKYLEGKTPKKIIFVKGKIINIVI